MLKRLLRVGGVVFVASTIAMLAWYKTEHLRSAAAPIWPGVALIGISVATLPLALGNVIKESDAASLRNWAILLGLCIALVALV